METQACCFHLHLLRSQGPEHLEKRLLLIRSIALQSCCFFEFQALEVAKEAVEFQKEIDLPGASCWHFLLGGPYSLEYLLYQILQ